MTRKPPAEQDTPAKTAHDSDDRPYKTKFGALLLSAVAAGGVTSLSGWDAQAHGNRSSHMLGAASSSAAPGAKDGMKSQMMKQRKPGGGKSKKQDGRKPDERKLKK